ncbi:glycosyltransferase family 2 protein [Gemmobacter lanyuensis]
MTRLSCIIPAHNEAARLGGVLAAVSGHPLIDELIVVDDASRDTTAEIAAQAFGVTLIRQERNTGKTRAVARGLAAARGDLILLLDADLVGLAPGT